MVGINAHIVPNVEDVPQAAPKWSPVEAGMFSASHVSATFPSGRNGPSQYWDAVPGGETDSLSLLPSNQASPHMRGHIGVGKLWRVVGGRKTHIHTLVAAESPNME